MDEMMPQVSETSLSRMTHRRPLPKFYQLGTFCVEELARRHAKLKMNIPQEPSYCFFQYFQSYPSKRLVHWEEGGDLNHLDIQHFQTQIPLSPQNE
jgi:hypothetical protein